MNNKELTELERIAEIHNYDTELDELLDCPFCGGRPVAFLRGNEHLNKSGKEVSVTIRCPNCRIERTDAVLKNSIEWLEEVAIKNWNNRSSVPSHEEIKREAVEGFAHYVVNVGVGTGLILEENRESALASLLEGVGNYLTQKENNE